MTTLINMLPKDGSIGTIHDAETCLTHIEAELHKRDDLRAAFAALYLIVTRRVAVAVLDPCGPFHNPIWISTLAARFAARYVDTLRRSMTSPASHDCHAWSYAYEACDRLLSPIRCGILGLSAHILADLAVGVASLLIEEGPELSPQQLAHHKADHDAVNVILEGATAEVLATLDLRYGCQVSRVLRGRGFSGLLRVAMAPLYLARAQVWTDALDLAQAASTGQRWYVRNRVRKRADLIGSVLSMDLPCSGSRFFIKSK